MKNVLLENVEYQIDKTSFGVWRRYFYPTGAFFAEFKSHKNLFGLPLFHYTRGICPKTGKRVVRRKRKNCYWNSSDRPGGVWEICVSLDRFWRTCGEHETG